MKFEEIGIAEDLPLGEGAKREPDRAKPQEMMRVPGLAKSCALTRRASRWLSRRPLPEGEGLPPKERNGHEGAEYDNPSTNQRGVHSPGDSRARIAAND